MNNRRIYFIAFALLGLGLFASGLKRFQSAAPGANADRMTLAWSDVGVTPYVASFNDTPPTIVKKSGGLRGGFRLSGRPVGKTQTYALNDGEKTAEKLAEGKARSDKTKKKARKKKKKDEKTMVAKTDSAPLYPESKKRNQESDDSGMGFNAAGGPAPAAEDKNKEPQTYEEWTKFILGNPSLDNVQKMIDSYKVSQITADVFFGVLNEMIKQPSQNLHELAVYAAGSVPEAQSFMFLVDFLKVTSPSEAVAADASEHLNNYRIPRHAPQIKSVMNQRMEDTETLTIALQVLNRSTTQYLEQRAPTAESAIDLNFPPATGTGAGAGTDPASGATANRGTQNYYRFYVGLDATLQRVLTVHGDKKEIADLANASLARIRAAAPATATNTLAETQQ